MYYVKANEVLHMNPDGTPKVCAKLNDILEDDNFNQYEEILRCEIQNSDDCKIEKDTYKCKKYLH
jgi:hypothetical protein